ncbi:prenylcysteine lyase [Nitzschia inconspicua]|uniref:Prenylcysteine lyase n=1 Tax=Nitzschia inconspicua TaxID=303405 RepID=A0A9K3PFC5_9STRA|nr:prenylcysteine lyase [Nitzschia inconspicua]
MLQLLVLALLAQCQAQRIAILGGGRSAEDITSTFVAKYLMDFLPSNCSSFQSLLLFDQNFHDNENGSKNRNMKSHPAYRDSFLFAGGDSAIFSSKLDPLVTEMIRNSNLNNLTTIKATLDDTNASIVFHDGNGAVALETTMPNLLSAFYWRYNVDYYVVSRLASKVKGKLEEAHRILEQESWELVQSPAHIWNHAGMGGLTRMSFDLILEKYRVTEVLPLWRQYLPWISQGSFRREALSSILLRQYHQDVSQVNGLAGLIGFLSAMEDDNHKYVVKGGIEEVTRSAWEQTLQSYQTKCPDRSSVAHSVSLQPLQVVTVVGSVSGFELYNADGRSMGEFDQVILTQPLSSCGIDFLIKSHVDETAVLQPMPLGGLIENSEDVALLDHDGHDPLPRRLPGVATRPYTRIVTTVVEDATLQLDYWLPGKSINSASPDWTPPQQIFMTSSGRTNEFNVTNIARINQNVYKITSSQPLSIEILRRFFGYTVKVLEETSSDIAPDYQGDGIATPFLLYDGSTGFQGHTKAGALYYPRAMELTVSNIEMKAIGAKAVAKLIANRLVWIETTKSSYGGDEL